VEIIFLAFMCWQRPYMNKQTNGFAIAIASINAFNMLLMIFFSDVFGLPGLANGVLGVAWFVINAVFALVLLILITISCCYALFSKNPEARYQPMRDDRSSFIRNAKESSTELDALAANLKGDGKDVKEWGNEGRLGAQSPEEQYGRFRPMSQSSLRPFTQDSNSSFNTPPNNNSQDPFSRPREMSSSGLRTGAAPVRGPRDYEGYNHGYAMRSESPLGKPPGSSGGDMWKRGVGFD
jgi:uncharacterized membrane protein